MKASLRGYEKLKAFLAELPRGTKIAAMRAAAEYFVGDEQHGLKHNPERVNHGPENPYEWQSEKQRRAYFATDGFGGGIPYRRTGSLSDGWSFSEQDSNWTMVKLENPVSYGQFVQGVNIQRGHIADGWRKYGDIILTNMKGAIQAAQRAVDEYIKSKR